MRTIGFPISPRDKLPRPYRNGEAGFSSTWVWFRATPQIDPLYKTGIHLPTCTGRRWWHNTAQSVASGLFWQELSCRSELGAVCFSKEGAFHTGRLILENWTTNSNTRIPVFEEQNLVAGDTFGKWEVESREYLFFCVQGSIGEGRNG